VVDDQRGRKPEALGPQKLGTPYGGLGKQQQLGWSKQRRLGCIWELEALSDPVPAQKCDMKVIKRIISIKS
jgi:hypothetical protein